MVTRDPASFRDPRGHVYVGDGRVLRTVLEPGRADFEFVRESGLLDRLMARREVISAEEVPSTDLGDAGVGACHVLAHPKLDFISYPYEWSFGALKAAAELTLDVHLEALDAGVTLSDASAYNVQFAGPEPIFIDYLSFRRYRDGEFWVGHRQFCEQFLNPLLLTSYTGVPFQAWYRGSLEGIPATELAPLLPRRRFLSWRVFTNVVLQARLNRPSASARASHVSKMKLPTEGFRNMLRSMRSWIGSLDVPGKARSVWADYSKENTYTDEAARRKAAAVAELSSRLQPGLLIDLGCNTGEYSRIALAEGSRTVVGLESDHGALNRAYEAARADKLSFLPLYFDAANPSPSQGWGEQERRSLTDRAHADAVLALAFIHHLVIARNIPLDEAVDWIISLAPAGLIEFVPKEDSMVQLLLRLREDIFADYTEAAFLAAVKRRARVAEVIRLPESGRALVRFERP